jgi:hypothetical protein
VQMWLRWQACAGADVAAVPPGWQCHADVDVRHGACHPARFCIFFADVARGQWWMERLLAVLAVKGPPQCGRRVGCSAVRDLPLGRECSSTACSGMSSYLGNVRQISHQSFASKVWARLGQRSSAAVEVGAGSGRPEPALPDPLLGPGGSRLRPTAAGPRGRGVGRPRPSVHLASVGNRVAGSCAEPDS